jgi:hypothetical protein
MGFAFFFSFQNSIFFLESFSADPSLNGRHSTSLFTECTFKTAIQTIFNGTKNKKINPIHVGTYVSNMTSASGTFVVIFVCNTVINFEFFF